MITPDTREYRTFSMDIEKREEDENETGYVEGYACIFNDPEVMMSMDGIDYKEQVDANAFAGAKMSDVVLNYNHGGKPLARTKNSTLELSVDQHGLKVRALLGGTDDGRKLLEEIKGGYIDKMSFAFTVSEDAYDRATHTRTIQKIDRLYDVAAVDFPAYEATSISARSKLQAEAEAEKAEALERRKKKIKILAEVNQ